MANRALRELTSLPLFQWESSARSSDHPARGELLNMPTYDVNTFTRQTRRLRSQAGSCPVSKPPTHKKEPSTAKAKGHMKKRPACTLNSSSGDCSQGGKENVTGHSIPARICLGPVTPSGPGHTPTGDAEPLSSNTTVSVFVRPPAEPPHTGNQDAVASVRLFPDAPKVGTPQQRSSGTPCLHHEEPGTLSPVLNTPCALDSYAQGTTDFQIQPDAQASRATHYFSHTGMATMSLTPPSSATALRSLKKMEVSCHLVSSSQHGCSTVEHSVAVTSRAAARDQNDQEHTLKPASDCEPACTSIPGEYSEIIPQFSPASMDVPLASEEEPRSAPDDCFSLPIMSSVGAIHEWPGSGTSGQTDEPCLVRHAEPSLMQDTCVPQPSTATPQKLAAFDHFEHVDTRAPDAALQQSPLDMLATVAAAIAPVDDTVLASAEKALPNVGASVSLAAAPCPDPRAAVPSPLHQLQDDVGADTTFSLNSILAFLANAVTANAVQASPAVGAQDLAVLQTAVAITHPAEPTGMEAPSNGEEAFRTGDGAMDPHKDVSAVGNVHLMQPSYTSTAELQSNEAMNRSRTREHSAPQRIAPGRRVQQEKKGTKRIYSSLRPPSGQGGNYPQTQGIADKKTRYSPGDELYEHRCYTNADKASIVDRPIAALFKPSKKLDLFLPSATLESGRAWITTWLP